jgi:3-deoxy-D-manno-octulosonic-acid transferase
MAKSKQLRKRQLAVIDDLFGGELDEQGVLAKHKLSRNVYNKWLSDEQFCAELARRVANARLQSEVLIARYSLLAAAKLVQLTESEKEETSRKACLDIISLPKVAAKKAEQSDKAKKDSDQHTQQVSAKTASRLLAALAEEKRE